MAGDPVLWSQVAGWLWDRRDDILGLVKTLTDWFGSSKAADGSDRGILILGAGGVGKTTLARILSGKFDWLLDEPWRYGESFGIERFSLKDDPKVQVVVPPGQTARREATWTDLLANISAGMYRGVILVSAYGYHSLRPESFKDHELFQGKKPDFLAALLEQHRKDELDILNQLAPHLAASNGKVWLLSLLTKEDLWADDRPEVENWLQAEYATRISGVAQQKGTAHFRHEQVSASLVIGNYVTKQGEVLQKNLAGYDHRRAVESLRRFLEVIDALRQWENQK